MVCINCGHQLKKENAFCPKCGTPVIRKTQPRIGGKAVLASTVLLAVAVAGAAAVVLIHPWDKGEAESRENMAASAETMVMRETEPVGTALAETETAPTETAVMREAEPAETLPVESTFEAYETSDSAQEQEQPVNLDEEITQIRKWFYWTQDNLGNMVSENRDGIIYVWDAGAVRKVTVPAGVDAAGYSREYYFVDGRLYFAFVYKKSAENRFYFLNDRLIRYIDENRETHDLEAADAYADAASGCQKEAYALIGQEFDPLLGSGPKTHIAQNDVWKQAYMDYIRQHSNSLYLLFYMDDDDIPELLVWDGDSSGSIVTVDNHTGRYDESEDLGLYYEPEYESGVCVLYMAYQNFVNVQYDTACGGGLTTNDVYVMTDGKVRKTDEFACNGVMDQSGSVCGTEYWHGEEQISGADYKNMIHKEESVYLDFPNGYTAGEMAAILD